MASRALWRPCLVSALFVLPSIAMAAEETGGSGGMPQLDPTSFISQIVWLIIAFSVLYYILNKKLLPGIVEVRTARQARLDEDLQQAAELRGKAEAALAEYDQVVTEAHAKANEAIKQAQDKLQAELAERQAKIDADITAKLEAASQRIDAARKAALDDINNVAVEAARAATSKLIGTEISADEAAQVVQQLQREVA